MSDDLRKSLSELTTVVDGLAQKISGSIGDSAVDPRSRWEERLGQTS